MDRSTIIQKETFNWEFLKMEIPKTMGFNTKIV